MESERDSLAPGSDGPDNGVAGESEVRGGVQGKNTAARKFALKRIGLREHTTDHEIEFVRNLGHHSEEGPHVGKRVLLERYKSALLNKRKRYDFNPTRVLEVVDEELLKFRHVWKEHRI